MNHRTQLPLLLTLAFLWSCSGDAGDGPGPGDTPCDELYFGYRDVVDEVCADDPDCSLCGPDAVWEYLSDEYSDAECEEMLFELDSDALLDLISGNCEQEASGASTNYCPGYAGGFPCCQLDNPCNYETNDTCDCDGTCAWDVIDCHF